LREAAIFTLFAPDSFHLKTYPGQKNRGKENQQPGHKDVGSI